MTTLALSQSKTAVGANITASFLATGGTSPYTYSVRSGGAGGTINSSTGLYTAPPAVSPNPLQLYDTIQVADNASPKNIATAQIFVGTPLLLFCDIIQNQMGLDNNHIYLWEQKLFQPTDSSLYVAVSVLSCKPFGNTNYFNGSTQQSIQSVNMYAQLQLDIISRGPAARDQKELVIMALNSNYSQSQQQGNGFFIGELPPGSHFVNLSNIDGAAIPYRFAISVAMQYFVQKITAVPYFSSFPTPTVITNA
jgi:hypothetical protein